MQMNLCRTKKVYDLGQASESVTLFEQVLAAYAEEGNTAQIAQVANDLGVVYYLVGRRDEAKKVLEKL